MRREINGHTGGVGEGQEYHHPNTAEGTEERDMGVAATVLHYTAAQQGRSLDWLRNILLLLILQVQQAVLRRQLPPCPSQSLLAFHVTRLPRAWFNHMLLALLCPYLLLL